MALAFIKSVLVLAASLPAGSKDRALLKTYGGQIDSPNLTRYIDHGAYNNDRCWKNFAGQACEEVRIHNATSTVFLACGSSHNRSVFYPPLLKFGGDPSVRFYEYFLKYEIETNTTTRLQIEGWNPDDDLVLHGFDIMQSEKNASEIYVYAINHARAGERVALFTHALGTNTFQFTKQYSHPWITTPNSVAAAGPSSFYISNIHTFYDGLFRQLEDEYGPWKWASQVVYCTDTEIGGLYCFQVSPENAHTRANGIKLINQGKTMMVNDAVLGTTFVYDVNATTKIFTLNQTISFGTVLDNIEQSDFGDMTVAAPPDRAGVSVYFSGNNSLNSSVTTKAAVFRLVKDRDWTPELLFWDDGSLIGVLTGTALSEKHNMMVAGGTLADHFIICDIKV